MDEEIVWLWLFALAFGFGFWLLALAFGFGFWLWLLAFGFGFWLLAFGFGLGFFTEKTKKRRLKGNGELELKLMQPRKKKGEN